MCIILWLLEGLLASLRMGSECASAAPKSRGTPPPTHTHRRRTRLIHELVPQLRRLSDLKFQTPQTKLSEEEVGRSAPAQLGVSHPAGSAWAAPPAAHAVA